MWALFCDDQQISRAFEAESEVWYYARKSSLIANSRLQKHYEIRELIAAAVFPKAAEA